MHRIYFYNTRAHKLQSAGRPKGSICACYRRPDDQSWRGEVMRRKGEGSQETEQQQRCCLLRRPPGAVDSTPAAAYKDLERADPIHALPLHPQAPHHCELYASNLPLKSGARVLGSRPSCGDCETALSQGSAVSACQHELPRAGHEIHHVHVQYPAAASSLHCRDTYSGAAGSAEEQPAEGVRALHALVRNTRHQRRQLGIPLDAQLRQPRHHRGRIHRKAPDRFPLLPAHRALRQQRQGRDRVPPAAAQVLGGGRHPHRLVRGGRNQRGPAVPQGQQRHHRLSNPTVRAQVRGDPRGQVHGHRGERASQLRLPPGQLLPQLQLHQAGNRQPAPCGGVRAHHVHAALAVEPDLAGRGTGAAVPLAVGQQGCGQQRRRGVHLDLPGRLAPLRALFGGLLQPAGACVGHRRRRGLPWLL